MSICKAPHCDQDAKKAGWCHKHYSRVRRHGSPDINNQHRAQLATCNIEGCSKRAKSLGMCVMHYTRQLRHGDPANVHTYPGVTMHSEGYRLVRRNAHSLADSRGYVPEHRLVLWEQLSGKDTTCHWCGMAISWAKRWPKHRDALVVDHLDDDKLNNDPVNLVASCNPCNSTRAENSGRFTAA